MWAVAKIKKKELSIFKEKLTARLGKNIKFYCPKIVYHKYFGKIPRKVEQPILENYLFCYHEKFEKTSTSLGALNFVQGLQYFVKGHEQNQSEILKFINHCKSFENKEGYLSSAFFKTMLTKRAKFITGPFANLIFEIIEKQKNKLKILIGGIVTTISDKENYLYHPI